MFKITGRKVPSLLLTTLQAGHPIVLYILVEILNILITVVLASKADPNNLPALMPALQWIMPLIHFTSSAGNVIGLRIKDFADINPPQLNAARKIAAAAMAIMLMPPLVIIVAYLFFKKQMTTLFLNPAIEDYPTVEKKGEHFLLFFLLTSFVNVIRLMSIGMLRGFGSMKPAFFVNTASTLGLNLPLALVATFLIKSPTWWILGAYAAGITCCAAEMGRRLCRIPDSKREYITQSGGLLGVSLRVS